MTVDGEPIRTRGLKNPRNFGRLNWDASLNFLEWEAATAAGLDLWRWEQGEYPKRFRARVMAWYNLHNLLDTHRRDASIPKKRR